MNLLREFPDHIADEYRNTARELCITDFWDSFEKFTDAFSSCPALDPVMKHLFTAMNPQTEVSGRLEAIRLARAELEDFVAEDLDDEYIRLAINGVAI